MSRNHCGSVLRPAHRDDIDALRAVAVGLVILFHFGVPGFSGGFVGVDVFFVISGFLIGGIIDRELSARQFSLVAFYERRVRRIFPALFAVLAVTAGVAALLLYPPDYVRFGRSAGAAALFWSNIFFFNTAGYWDTAASSKPLLHTWSLAVEEQFYLVFPLMLFAIRKWAVRGRLAALALMAVASFGASVWAVHATPTAAFYLAPYRFWEFVIGAMLAVAAWRAPPRLASVTSLAGLALILAAGTLLPKGGAFPGWAALLPCVGAALVIAAGPDNVVSRALAWRPVVFVGLISYSLYLWHWPVIVLARQWLGVLKPWQVAVCAAVTFAASVLSWRFIEQPFRNRAAVTRKPLFVAAGAAMACVCLFAIVTIRTGGLPNRFDPKIVAIMEQELAPRPAEARCFGVAAKDVSVARLCGIGAEGQAASFVLWGDSHAEAILPAVADIARKHNRRGLFAGAPSCAPLIGVNLSNAPKCRAFNDRVLAMILRHKEITTVILEARWGKTAAGTAYGNEGNGFVAISDDQGRATKPEDNAAIFARGLDRTVAALRAGGKQVLLVGPVPEIGFTVPQVLAKLVELHRENAVVSPPAEKFYAREKAVLPVFQKAAAQDGVFAVYPHDFLCASGRCAVRNNGIPLYRDEHHLSDYGAKKLEPLLSRAIDPLFDKVS
jgi:peptidoglycan/LPS O-acetylase OafA/YrhL